MDEKKRINNKRRHTWSRADEKVVIQIWKDFLPDLRTTRKNYQIYKQMAAIMKEAGVIVEPIEVRFKINNFTQRYRSERKTSNATGEPSTWRYYSDIHDLIGNYKCDDLELVEESFPGVYQLNDLLNSDESAPSTTTVFSPSMATILSPSTLPKLSPAPPVLSPSTKPILSPSMAVAAGPSSSSSPTLVEQSAVKQRKRSTVQYRILETIKKNVELAEKECEETRKNLEKYNKLEERKIGILEHFLAGNLRTQDPLLLDHSTMEIDKNPSEISLHNGSNELISNRKRKNSKDTDNTLQDSVNVALDKLLDNSETNDEFYHFGMNVVHQMRKLPIEKALQCQEEIQRILLKQRLEFEESKLKLPS